MNKLEIIASVTEPNTNVLWLNLKKYVNYDIPLKTLNLKNNLVKTLF